MGKDTKYFITAYFIGQFIYLYAVNNLFMRPKEITPEYQELFIDIGKRIKDLRKSKGMGYIEMAEEIGISRNAYNQLELGISNFQFITLLAVLKYHGIGLTEFFQDI